MKKNDPSINSGQSLRQQAETSLGQQKKASLLVTEVETQRLVHELQVHQIELELQNDELVQARAETEAALRQYTALYDFAPVGYLTLARDGEIHQVNLAGAALLGLERCKLFQRRLGIFVNNQSRPVLSAFLNQVFSSGKNQVCEIKLLQTGSAPLWVHLEAAITDEKRETCRAVLVDISARKQAEDALIQRESLLNKIFEVLPVGIWLADKNGQLTHSNPRGREIWGAEPLVGQEQYGVFKAWRLPTREELAPEDWALMHSIQKGLTVLDEMLEIEAFDGKTKVILNFTAPVFDATGNVEAAVIINLDITERKQMEDALRESEDEFRMLAESMPQIVWVCQPDGKNIYYNQHWVDYTGMTLEESYGDGWNKPFHPEDQQRAWEAWQNATKNLSEYSIECRLRRADGAYTWWLIRGVPLVDTKGQVLKWFGTCTDIDKLIQAENEIRQMNAELEARVEERTRELREAQEKLVRQEKLAVLGQLAGGVGHELRNPLGVIRNAVYYLGLIQPDANEKVKEYLAMIQQETHTADKIITDLLEFSRLKSVDPQRVVVADWVKHTLERFPAPENVRVTRQLPEDLPALYVDPRQMTQVLGNLVVNACQAMPAGGTLTISVAQQAEEIAIAVQDTGMGIPPENMHKLFEPLFTTKPKGIGLGLAVSKKLAEANDGRIEVQSEVGKGSTFTIFLPTKVLERT